MAIQAPLMRPRTGASFPQAHHVLQPPIFQHRAKQVTVVLLAYASKADYDAGRDPVHRYERTFGANEYDALMDRVRNLVEPALIQRFFPQGTRVPD